MNLETYVRAQMARFAMEEGWHHGGVTNMLAVAHVLRNRVFAGWGDWLEVVVTAPEKRAVIYPPMTAALRSKILRGGNVRALLNHIDEIYTRATVDDMTGGALFYLEPALTTAQWFVQEVIERPDDHPRTAHIGPVWFYK
jgi:hypothetical protein